MDLFEGDLDFHSATALAVFGDVAMRDESKPINHGANYGMSVNKMVQHGVRRDMAEKFMRVMREKYSGVIDWQERVRAIARRGELLDNGFGRKLKASPEFAYTQAPAFVGQSATRDAMIEAILRMPADVQRMIMFTVHDEIVLSVPKDRIEEATAIVKDAMTFEWKPMWMDDTARSIQICCGVSKPGRNWAECYVK
jgi:DNA polymerase-1